MNESSQSPEDEVVGVHGEQDSNPVLPSVEEGTLPQFDPFPVGSSLLGPDGREYEVLPTAEPDSVRVKAVGDGPDVDMVKSRADLEHNLRGATAEWAFKELDVDRLIWKYPAFDHLIAQQSDQPDQVAAIRANLDILIKKETTDVDTLLQAGEAVGIPGVTLVDVLSQLGYSPEMIKQVKERLLGKEETNKPEDSPEAQAAVEQVKALMEDAKAYQSVLDGKKPFSALSAEEQGGYNGMVARLRAKLNDFKETKVYGGLKFSLKALVIFIAAAILLEMMVIRVHAGAGGKGR